MLTCGTLPRVSVGTFLLLLHDPGRYWTSCLISSRAHRIYILGAELEPFILLASAINCRCLVTKRIINNLLGKKDFFFWAFKISIVYSMSEVSWENPFHDKEVGFHLSPPISLASLALEEKTLRYNSRYLRIFL